MATVFVKNEMLYSEENMENECRICVFLILHVVLIQDIKT